MTEPAPSKPPGPEQGAPEQAPPPVRPPRRRGRKTRLFKRSVRITLGVPIALGLLALLVMRSPVVGWALKNTVRDLTGCNLQISGALISLDGRLIIRDFALVAPGVPGEAATFLTARRAAVDIDWSRALLLNVKVDALRLYDPRFVLSQSGVDGSVNIAALRAAAPPGAQGGLTLPSVDVLGGRILFTEHDASGDLTLLREVAADGSLTPRGAAPGVYTVRLQETGSRGMLMDGWVDLGRSAASVKLMNVALDTWKGASVPRAYRQLWDRLGIDGRIASLTLDYDVPGGPKARVVLDGVSMNALLPADKDLDIIGPPPPPRDLSLSGVTGEILFARTGLSADLTGVLEGQRGRSRLILITQGLSVNAPLTATLSARRLSLAKDPEFLPYMPPKAREYFQAFSGPTGELDIRLTVARLPADGPDPGPVRVSAGRVALTNGTAAFHRFPYPFTDIDGVFEFTDQELRITGLQGKGPTGARMSASGLIAPLTDESMIDITVKADNVPVDQALLDAMPPDRRRVVEQVFSRAAYERLVGAGVVRPLMASADQTGPTPPEFMLGGPASVTVHVFSPKGRDVPWFTTVDVAFDHAGVLPEALPLPILATGLKLRVTDDDAQVLGGTLTPISGGSVTLDARVVFRDQGVKVTRPDVNIRVTDLPVDRFLLSALALARDAAEQGPSPLARVADLRPAGLLNADLRLLAPPPSEARPVDADDLAYALSVDLSRLRLSPLIDAAPSGVDLAFTAGTLTLDDRTVGVAAANARLFDDGSPAGLLSLDATYDLAPDPDAARPRLSARAGFVDLDVSRPLERLLVDAAPQAAATIADLRAARRPSGLVSGHAELALPHAPPRPPAGARPDPRIDLTLTRAVDLGIDALNARLGLSFDRGAAHAAIAPGQPIDLRFDDLPVGITLDDRPCGVIILAGPVRVDPDRAGLLTPAQLEARLERWRLESPIIGPLLERAGGLELAARYARLEPAGEIDARLRLFGVGGQPPTLEAALTPRSLALTYDGQRIDLPEVSGAILLGTSIGPVGGPGAGAPVWGEVVDLLARSPNWTLGLRGDWRARPAQDGAPRAVDLDLAINAEIGTIDPALRALLPAQAARAVDALELAHLRPLVLDDARLRVSINDDTAPTAFSGLLRFEGLSMDVGLSVADAAGTLAMQVVDHGPGKATDLGMRLDASRLTVAGVRVGAAHATITSTDTPGELAIDPLSARVHAGRVTGSARVRAGNGADDRAAYDLDLVMSGVHLAPVLADVRLGAPDAPPAPPGPDEDPSRGLIDARLRLSGIAGDSAARRGSGAVRIADGDVLRLPLILPLIQLSNFQIPSADRLSYVQATFDVRCDQAVFDRISVLSRSIAIEGSGTLNIPDLTVDMVFNSRGNARVPLLSDFVDAVRNEIISTRLTGPAGDPVVSSQPLTGTRRLLSDVFLPGDPSRARPPALDPVDPRRESDRVRKAAGAGSRAEQPTD
jgi:hypothetical protein